jgi:hypothetical protein
MIPAGAGAFDRQIAWQIAGEHVQWLRAETADLTLIQAIEPVAEYAPRPPVDWVDVVETFAIAYLVATFAGRHCTICGKAGGAPSRATLTQLGYASNGRGDTGIYAHRACLIRVRRKFARIQRTGETHHA